MSNNGIVNIHGKEYMTVARRIELAHENKMLESIETDVLSHDPVAYEVFKQFGIGALAVVPMYTQDRWVGLMTFTWNESVEFNVSDERILTSVMRQAKRVCGSVA